MTTELARNRNPDFTSPAPEAIIQKVAMALRANNIDARIDDTGEKARRLVLELVPEGAEVHSSKSKTIRVGTLRLRPGAIHGDRPPKGARCGS